MYADLSGYTVLDFGKQSQLAHKMEQHSISVCKGRRYTSRFEAEQADIIVERTRHMLNIAEEVMRAAAHADIPSNLRSHVDLAPTAQIRMKYLTWLLEYYPGHTETRSAAEMATQDSDPEMRLKGAMALGSGGHSALWSLVKNPVVTDQVRTDAFTHWQEVHAHDPRVLTLIAQSHLYLASSPQLAGALFEMSVGLASQQPEQRDDLSAAFWSALIHEEVPETLRIMAFQFWRDLTEPAAQEMVTLLHTLEPRLGTFPDLSSALFHACARLRFEHSEHRHALVETLERVLLQPCDPDASQHVLPLANALLEIVPPDACTPTLVSMLSTNSFEVQSLAIEALTRLGDRRALGPLTRYTDDVSNEPQLQDDAQAAITAIEAREGPRAFGGLSLAQSDDPQGALSFDERGKLSQLADDSSSTPNRRTPETSKT
ncbi:MAG: HEAT repeat domain-containing protein [Bradymonadia bacterium]